MAVAMAITSWRKCRGHVSPTPNSCPRHPICVPVGPMVGELWHFEYFPTWRPSAIFNLKKKIIFDPVTVIVVLICCCIPNFSRAPSPENLLIFFYLKMVSFGAFWVALRAVCSYCTREWCRRGRKRKSSGQGRHSTLTYRWTTNSPNTVFSSLLKINSYSMCHQWFKVAIWCCSQVDQRRNNISPTYRQNTE